MQSTLVLEPLKKSLKEPEVRNPQLEETININKYINK